MTDLSGKFGMFEMEQAAAHIVEVGKGKTVSICDFVGDSDYLIVGFGNLIAYGWVERDEEFNESYKATDAFWERVKS